MTTDNDTYRENATADALVAYTAAELRGYPHAFAMQAAVDAVLAVAICPECGLHLSDCDKPRKRDES